MQPQQSARPESAAGTHLPPDRFQYHRLQRGTHEEFLPSTDFDRPQQQPTRTDPNVHFAPAEHRHREEGASPVAATLGAQEIAPVGSRATSAPSGQSDRKLGEK
jgi:hypothetical protein